MRLLNTLIILIAFTATSCSEIKTSDPVESYKYWAGADPTDDLKLFKGKYWQSSHWTKEYVLYLKFKPTEVWWTEFIELNQLQATKEKWDRPSDSPDWFQPTNTIEILKPADDFNSSRYFRDKSTGECFIYEIQL